MSFSEMGETTVDPFLIRFEKFQSWQHFWETPQMVKANEEAATAAIFVKKANKNRKKKTSTRARKMRMNVLIVQPVEASNNGETMEVVENVTTNSSTTESQTNDNQFVENMTTEVENEQVLDMEIVEEERVEENIAPFPQPSPRFPMSKQSLQMLIKIAGKHDTHCDSDCLKVIGQKTVRRTECLEVKCTKCNEFIHVPLENESNCAMRYNEAVVWSMYQSASYHEQMNNLLTAMQLPVPSRHYYEKEEKQLYEKLKGVTEYVLKENNKQEFDLAIEEGDYVEKDGKKVPFITVVVDGSWPKRSYGHSAKSTAGMAAIVGLRTGKVLSFDIRSVDCHACKVGGGSDPENPIPHDCQKNFEAAAQAMEADIICDGFRKSIPEYGIIYNKMIGDGDSSTFSTVFKKNFYAEFGMVVCKIECINHALKNLKAKLMVLLLNSNINNEDRNVLKGVINQFIRDVRGAVTHNSLLIETVPYQELAIILAKEIRNVLFHVFGDHSRCADYIPCKQGEKNLAPKYEKGIMWNSIYEALNYMANRADRLLPNLTSNRAESLMAEVAKFVCGKRINFTQKYGYGIRVHCASLAYQYGPMFLAHVYDIMTGKMPPENWLLRNNEIQKQAKRNQEYKQKLKLARNAPNSVSTKQKANDSGSKFYGRNPNDQDMNEDLYKAQVIEHLQKLKLTEPEIEKLNRDTEDQAFNYLWKIERRRRMPGSFCAKVFSLRDCTDTTSTIKTHLHAEEQTELREDDPRIVGQKLEPVAREAFEKWTNVVVKKCGLYVYSDNPIFGTSCDGFINAEDQNRGDEIIDEKYNGNGCIEIKCTNVPAHQIPTRKNDKFLQWADKDKTQLRLKRNHKYYYQVVQELNVTGREFCVFIVYFHDSTEKQEHDLWMEIIHRTETLDTWAGMLAKNEIFYFFEILPELLDSRVDRQMPIKQSEYRTLAMECQAKEKEVGQENKKKEAELKEKHNSEIQELQVKYEQELDEFKKDQDEMLDIYIQGCKNYALQHFENVSEDDVNAHKQAFEQDAQTEYRFRAQQHQKEMSEVREKHKVETRSLRTLIQVGLDELKNNHRQQITLAKKSCEKFIKEVKQAANFGLVSTSETNDGIVDYECETAELAVD